MSPERPPADPFLALSDEAAHRAAVRSRVEARERRQRAVELATWHGSLRDLAERGAPVVVSTRAGQRRRGSLVVVASDHVQLATDAGWLLLADAEVTAVRWDPDGAPVTARGERDAARDQTLAERLDRLAADRPRLRLRLAGGEALTGRLLGVGEDVASLRLEGDGGPAAHVRVAAIAEVAEVAEP